MRKLKKYKPTKFKAKDSVYNKELADYAVSFIECLCHTKGTWAGKPFELIDWQEQIIRDIGKIGTCGCSGTASDLWRWKKREVKFMAVLQTGSRHLLYLRLRRTW